MSNPGRSLDDMPLAAYSTGVVEDEPEEEAVAEPSHLSQQEAIALAMGVEPPASTEPEPAVASGRRGPAMPRLSVPRPSLPRLPRFGGRARAAAVAESPFSVASSVGVASPALAMPVAQYPTSTPLSPPASPATPRRARRLDLGGLGASLRNPRTAVRDPRVLFGGMIAIGAVLLGVSFLGGANLGGAGATATATPAPGAVAATTPGSATVQLTGEIAGEYSLTGSIGFGRPADGQLASTWTDAAGTALALTGRAGSGTRTTTPDLVLAVTVVVRGAPVTFTSEAGECTVGMAEKLLNVTGSFVCPKVTSDDGRVTLKITGTYKT